MLKSKGEHAYVLARADAVRLPLPDRSVDLVVGSPPYCEARTYGIDAGRKCEEWVSWMLEVTTEALRVSRGCVIWVASGVTRDRDYWPACEGLIWQWFFRGGSQYRPCYWRRFGIPGSGQDEWFRSDVEYCMCFKRPGELPWADNTAMGGPVKYASHGKSSNRRKNGSRNKSQYNDPDLANPGNLIDTGAAGGGNLGNHHAHDNEAPFPEDLPEFFIRSLAPPGGIILDPFSGSGTSVAVAQRFGRHGIGFDLRQSQCDLATRRIDRPHSPRVHTGKKPKPMPLFREEIDA